MVRLALIFAFCFLRAAFPQGFTLQDTAFLGNAAQRSFVPTQISGMAYYWNYTDLTANASVSSWVDRIQSAHMDQLDPAFKPTNSASGVGFAGWFLTNGAGVTLPNAKYSIWISHKATSTAGGFHMLVGKFDGNSGFFHTGTTLTYYFGGNHDLCSVAANVSYDLVYANGGTGAAGGGVGYTNGVATATVTDNGSVSTFSVVGSDVASEAFAGFIKFIGIWTNKTLTLSDAQNLYTYGSTH